MSGCSSIDSVSSVISYYRNKKQVYRAAYFYILDSNILIFLEESREVLITTLLRMNHGVSV